VSIRQNLFIPHFFFQHGNCPTCRHTFLDIRLPSESDDESSDGGEYIPDDDFDDEEDGFIDTSDGFSDAFDYLAEDMDTDVGDEWGDEAPAIDADMEDAVDEIDDEAVWGLTDGESSNMSELDDAALNSEDGDPHAGMEIGVNLTVHGDFESVDADILSESSREEK